MGDENDGVADRELLSETVKMIKLDLFLIHNNLR